MYVSCVFPSLWLSFQITAVSNAYSLLFLYFPFFLQVAVSHTLAQQIHVLNEPDRNVPSKAAVFSLLQLPINWRNWSFHWAQKCSKIWLTLVICVTLSKWSPTLILVKWLNMKLPPSSQPWSFGSFAVGSLCRGHHHSSSWSFHSIVYMRKNSEGSLLAESLAKVLTILQKFTSEHQGQEYNSEMRSGKLL